MTDAEDVNALPKTMLCPYHSCLPEYQKDIVNERICFHYWYCPECKKENPTPGRHNAFGYGYSSQTSKSAAHANWNNAVHRRQLSILKKAIKSG